MTYFPFLKYIFNLFSIVEENALAVCNFKAASLQLIFYRTGSFEQGKQNKPKHQHKKPYKTLIKS